MSDKKKKDKLESEVRETNLAHDDKKDKKSKKEVAEGPEQSRRDYQELAQGNLAGWQKALADYQNLEKEMNKRLANMNDFVAAGFILDLLPIFDNYQVAILYIPAEQQKASWAVGLEHILKMWEGFLAEHDVVKIKTVDNQFDPNLHEAVGQTTDDKLEDQIIVEEKLAGYISKDKVIRPAKVIINNKN